MRTQAQYDGWCPACREPIVVGEFIDFDDDEQIWRHSNCQVKEKPLAPLCGKCFLHHVGDCF